MCIQCARGGRASLKEWAKPQTEVMAELAGLGGSLRFGGGLWGFVSTCSMAFSLDSTRDLLST